MGQNHHSTIIKDYIEDRVEEESTMSLRILARETGISQSKVMNVLHENLYHPYHFTPVQELRHPGFQKRVTFCPGFWSEILKSTNSLERYCGQMSHFSLGMVC
ncbi:hypothetical protein TNCT_124821 [Trichonephila clavata]|uniref:Uncharacterized protein n=1 Tax=Trichonephila clavata TaxID=2740835 RepID=A0A8X6GGA2_TRICU|nr:hypothetical protein TNCT_124821 [Trichonephila clavata]